MIADHRPALTPEPRGRYAPTGPARLNEGPDVRLENVVLGLAGWPRARASHWLAPEGSRALMIKASSSC